jgi:hypothetical protein
VKTSKLQDTTIVLKYFLFMDGTVIP